MAKEQSRARFYLSCSYFCTLYFLVNMLLVKLKNLHTSASLNLMSNFLPPRGRVLFEVMSKYEQIQLFDSQMYLPVILIS